MRLRFIHWNTGEGTEKLRLLETFGFSVEFNEMNPRTLKDIRVDPPEVVVIDLSRSPSQGRDIGLAVRYYSETHGLPLVFLGGDPAKVEMVKAKLPDATYSDWGTAKEAIQGAVTNPVPVTTKPSGLLDGYAGAPLSKKLGVRAGIILTVIDPPEGFLKALGSLPEGAEIRSRVEEGVDVAVWFARTLREVEAGIISMCPPGRQGKLWVAWPKKGRGVESDLTEQAIRDAGLSRGLVDYKVARIDDTWAGLLFTRRKKV